MIFYKYLESQFKKHPSMQPQDFIKLCYQATFGAEHLLTDVDRAWDYFFTEYNTIQAEPGELYEKISPSLCRINLAAWKYIGMPAKWLFQMFVLSAKKNTQGNNATFLKCLEIIEMNLHELHVSFSLEEWKRYVNSYLRNGIRPIHHSNIYKNAEAPAYRLVDRHYLRLLPILEQAIQIPHWKQVKIIAIDGRAASGKSTLANELKEIIDASLIHMDDFFLPMRLRLAERLKTPGGNIHYERFQEVILPSIASPKTFRYRIFNCQTMGYGGWRLVKGTKWRIVEGSYSCHPAFGNYADLKIFSDVEEKEQMKRITERNGLEMAERFRTSWIPMEEQYFGYYHIKEKADIVI